MPAARKATAFDRDVANKKFDEDWKLLLLSPSIRAEKPPFAVLKEWWALHRGPGKLSIEDYFLYRLYDPCRSPEERARFISDSLHWPVVAVCNDLSWSAATEDKWLSYQLLERFGFPVPTTVAVIDAGVRAFGRTPVIREPMGLREFLREAKSFPIFAKPNRGVGSFGAFIITGIDGDRVLLDQAEPIGAAEIFSSLIGGHTYLLQNAVVNAAPIRALSPYCATVRTVNLVTADRVNTPFTLLKIPAKDAIADNYWRKGNMMADLDPRSGTIRRVVRGKGSKIEELTHHPDTGQELVGMTLPFWDRLCAVNEACARHFAPLRFHSLDIAVTDAGPVIVEVNNGAAFDLPQIASGRGLLTDEIRSFFAECGWRGWKKARRFRG